jgi:hypothetical protein
MKDQKILEAFFEMHFKRAVGHIRGRHELGG